MTDSLTKSFSWCYQQIILLPIFGLIIAAPLCLRSEEKGFHEIEFPGLSPTLHELNSGKPQVPTLMYQLPTNFSTEKKFPVLVFLDGGDARHQKSSGISRAIQITRGRDFIIASLPLYRNVRALDRNAIYGDLLIDMDDYPAIAKGYQPMLKKMFEVIPQAKQTGNIMGGFSNGAHTIGVLLSCDNPIITKHFSQFILIEGGCWMTGLARERMKANRFLCLYGDTADSWTRPLSISQFTNMKLFADGLGLKFDLVKMAGIGHQFPKRYNTTVKTWLLNGQIN